MLADISSSGATKYGMTLKIIGNVGRSSTILYRFQVLNILEEKKPWFLFFSLRFFFQLFGNVSDCSWSKIHIDSGKAWIQKHVRGE